MVQKRDANSLTADDLHDGVKRLKKISDRVEAIKTKGILEKLYVEFAEYQNTLFVSNNKTALSATTSISHAGYFIDFYKASKMKFKEIKIDSPKFIALLEDYWSYECSRKKVHVSKYSKKKILTNPLSKSGLDKSKDQLQLFLKFVKFRTQKNTKNRPVIKFNHIITSLPDEVRTIFDNPRIQKNKIVGTKKIITLDQLKGFIDFLNTKNRNDAILATILLLISENGYRWSELLTIKIKNFVDVEGMKVLEMENSKTFLRGTLVCYSWPYLRALMHNHPDKNNEEAFLFANKKGGRPVEYGALLKLFKQRLAEYNLKHSEKIDFPSGQKFHLLRHIAATRFAGWPTTLRDFYMGWITEGQYGKTYFEADFKENLNKCKDWLDKTFIEEKNPFIKMPPTNRLEQIETSSNKKKINLLRQAFVDMNADELKSLMRQADKND